MEKGYKYRWIKEIDSEEEQEFIDGALEKENVHILQLDLKSQQDSIELDLETETSGGLKLTLESNSRCVSVDTILPPPLGRKEKCLHG